MGDTNTPEGNFDALEERIAAIAALRPGWIDGTSGTPISNEEIHSATYFHQELCHLGFMEHASIFPTENGTVEFQWANNLQVLSIHRAPVGCYEYFFKKRHQPSNEGCVASLDELQQLIASFLTP